MGATFYKCGTESLASGSLSFTKTGAGLPFTPSLVVATVRMPDADADIVTAHLAGAPTEDGFTVEFSAAVGAGYRLDWVAYAGSVEAGNAGSLAISYDDLFDAVRRFLGYPVKASLTADQVEEVDSYVQGGVRQFYYPPAGEGTDLSHQWSFLRQSAELSLGEGEDTVTLPTGFIRLIGNMKYTDGRVFSVINVPEGIFRQTAVTTESGPPRIVCVRRIQSFGADGQLFEAKFWPKADKPYAVSFLSEGDGGKLDSTVRPYPLGGGRFSNLVRESCLAFAESAANDEQGIHWSRFMAELAAAEAQDKVAGGDNFGQMGDRTDPVYGEIASAVKPVITYKGTVL